MVSNLKGWMPRAFDLSGRAAVMQVIIILSEAARVVICCDKLPSARPGIGWGGLEIEKTDSTTVKTIAEPYLLASVNFYRTAIKIFYDVTMPAVSVHTLSRKPYQPVPGDFRRTSICWNAEPIFSLPNRIYNRFSPGSTSKMLIYKANWLISLDFWQ